MSNPNIGKEARKGGLARVAGMSKKQLRAAAFRAATIRWARYRVAKEKTLDTKLASVI